EKVCDGRKRPDDLALGVHGFAELLPAHRLHKELHPRFHTLFSLAVAVEDANNSGREIEKLLDRQKIGVETRDVRPAAHPAAYITAKAASRFAVLLARHGVESQIVKGERGMIFGAAFKGDLEFATHVLVELVAH